MTQPPCIFADTTWATVRDTDYDVAVLPWGSTEAHNYHLPYATDTIQCAHVAAESARRAWAEREWPRVTDDTGVGDPAEASAEKGEAYLERVTDAIADLLHDLAAADLDDLYVDPDA